MANYNGTTRSNYFLVNNKDKAELIFDSIITDGEIYCSVEETDKDGVFKCWFGSYGNIYGLHKGYDTGNPEEDDDEEDYDLMISELQSILVDGEYIQIIDIGYEKLRYVGGGCLIITKDKSEYIDLVKTGEELAKKLIEEGQKNLTNKY